MDEDGQTIYFDATLRPHVALSPKAFMIVMGLVGAMSFLFGLDALAIWFAFRKSFQNLREETLVRITAEAITLRHSRPGQEKRTVRLPTAFARLSLDFPDRRPSELRIAHGQTAYVIGRFLTPGERKSLHQAMQDAVMRARAERYA